jgi:hypothetical protein
MMPTPAHAFEAPEPLLTAREAVRELKGGAWSFRTATARAKRASERGDRRVRKVGAYWLAPSSFWFEIFSVPPRRGRPVQKPILAASET